MYKNSGIYKITNTTNGKVYIGSSTNLSKRKNTHFCKLKNNTHANKYLQSSFDKYGENSFKFEIIEYADAEFLENREQFWIDQLNSINRKMGYNLRRVSSSNFGYKHSNEAKKNMSLAHIGNFQTQLTKEKILENNPIRRQVINLDTNEVFKSARQAGKFYNTTHISEVCRGERETASGCKWSYV